jgi:uncharacterized protein (TIGR02246 family)
MKMFVLSLLAMLTTPAFAQGNDATSLLDKFMQAWSASDAKAIGALFAPDADFISPFGISAKGRADIETFYAAAFARGYAGSAGTAEIVSTRVLAPDVSLIDAHFTISGAHHEDGSARPEEKGIMVAVLRRGTSGWQIAALRENESASQITPLH